MATLPLLDRTAALLVRAEPHAALRLARQGTPDSLGLRLWVAAIAARAQAGDEAVESLVGETRGTHRRSVDMAEAILDATDGATGDVATDFARVTAGQLLSRPAVVSDAVARLHAQAAELPVHLDAYLVMVSARAATPRTDHTAPVQRLLDARASGDVAALTTMRMATPIGLAHHLLIDWVHHEHAKGGTTALLGQAAAAALMRPPALEPADVTQHATRDVFPIAVVAEALWLDRDGTRCGTQAMLLAGVRRLAELSQTGLPVPTPDLGWPAFVLASAADAAGLVTDQLADTCRWVVDATVMPASSEGHVDVRRHLAELVQSWSDARLDVGAE